jgi:hypothetical protein
MLEVTTTTKQLAEKREGERGGKRKREGGEKGSGGGWEEPSLPAYLPSQPL